MGWTAGGIIIGVVIVVLAVGIPYLYTHKRMREPYDAADSQAYLRARHRWWQFHWRTSRRGQRPGGTAPVPADPPLNSEPSPARPDSPTSDTERTAP